MDAVEKVIITDAILKFRVRAEKFTVRVDQMNEIELSVKPLEDLTSKAEELDKHLRENLSACFSDRVQARKF